VTAKLIRDTDFHNRIPLEIHKIDMTHAHSISIVFCEPVRPSENSRVDQQFVIRFPNRGHTRMATTQNFGSIAI
jgi:hypothetical protein